MMTALQYQITPLDLSGYQESLDELTVAWARQWAAQPLHLRLFAQLVPFRFERLYGPLVAAARDLPATAWERRWQLDQAYMYYKQEQRTQPLVLRHWLVLWAEGRLDRPTLTTLLRRAFALPAIVERPLPAFVPGRYRGRSTYLEPLDAGYPVLAILNAYEAQGDWDLLSWADLLLLGDVPLTLCIDVQHVDRAQARWAARSAFNRFSAALSGPFAVKDPDSERALRAAEQAMNELYRQNLHLLTYLVLIPAGHRAELEERVALVTARLSGRLKLDRLPQQTALAKFFSPIETARIPASPPQWNTLSLGLAAKTPWGLRRDVGNQGTCWGIGPTSLPVIRSVWEAALGENGHVVVLGQTGSGKTTGLLTWLLRHATARVEPCQIFFADPAGKGKLLTNAVGPTGSRYIALAGDETINPLDVVSTNLAAQSDAVRRKLMVVLGETTGERNNLRAVPRAFSELERVLIDIALEELYGPAGAALPAMLQGTTVTPVLADFVAVFTQVVAREQATAGTALARYLELFVRTSRGARFNAPTTISWQFDADVTAYSFENVPEELLPIYYAVVFEALDRYVRTRPQTNKRFIACIDEFKYMAQVDVLKEFVRAATKWWRNFLAAMWTADQNVGSYLGDAGALGAGAGHQIFSNTALKLLFHLDDSDLRLLQQVYPEIIHPEEAAVIRRAQEGECLAVFGTQVERLFVALTGQEYLAFVKAVHDARTLPTTDDDRADERGDPADQPVHDGVVAAAPCALDPVS